MFILFSICVFILFIILLVFYFLPENSKIFNIDIWHTNKRLIYDSESDSNNIFDIYSVSHFFHGILFFFIFKLLDLILILYLFYHLFQKFYGK